MKQDFNPSPEKNLHRRTVAITTVASCVAICAVVLPILLGITSPWIVNYLSNAMADEIRDQVQEQVTPVNAGLKVLIENNIAELEDQISALEYKLRTDSNYTALDAKDLTIKKRRLAAQRYALRAIIEAERSRQK